MSICDILTFKLYDQVIIKSDATSGDGAIMQTCTEVKETKEKIISLAMVMLYSIELHSEILNICLQDYFKPFIQMLTSLD